MFQHMTIETFDDIGGDESDRYALTTDRPDQSSQKKKRSNVSLFLNSLDKKRANVPSNQQVSKSSTLAEEMSAYRSLAQKEFNMIVHGDKDSNTVRHDVERFTQRIPSLFNSIPGGILEIEQT